TTFRPTLLKLESQGKYEDTNCNCSTRRIVYYADRFRPGDVWRIFPASIAAAAIFNWRSAKNYYLNHNKDHLSARRERLSRSTTGDVERQEVSRRIEWKRYRVESGKIPRREENRRQQILGCGRHERR